MKAECIAAIGQVFGRAPTDAEIRNVEGRIARAMRQEAAKDPRAWLAQPAHEQVKLGAERAAQELQAEVDLKQRRKALQVLAAAKLQQQLAAYPAGPMKALAHAIAFHTDAAGSVMSVESRAKAIERDGLRRMIDAIEQTAPRFFGIVESREGIRDVVRELHGESTGNADAARGAKAFKDVAEAMRQRFNAAGGDIGLLEDWGMPHHHSQLRVAKAGREAWIEATLPLLDRSRYVDEYGARLGDAEVRRFLGEAWETIATGGVNKVEPGMPAGIGSRANRGSESRQVHFKDADAFLDYQQQFGDRTPYEVMIDHISGVAKDIALVETFGPNPDHQFRQFRDRAVRDVTMADPNAAGRAQQDGQHLESLYGLVAGKTLPVASPRVAQFFDGLRNIMVASKLGSAVITAVTDEGTMRVAAAVNQLSQMQLARNELAALNPANAVEKRMALRAGLAMNTLAHTINRFGNEHLMSGWTAKVAQATMRASGMNAMTDARRRAYGVTMMSSIGAVVRDTAKLADLDVHDARILRSKGITDAEWEVWRAAQLEDWGGGNDTMLTPDAIYRVPDQAIARIVAPEMAKVRAGLDAEIAELDARNQKESEWLARRDDAFQQAQQEATTKLEELRTKAAGKANAAIDELQARAELLQAEMELVAARRGLAVESASESSADRVRGLMARAATAEDVAGLIEGSADNAAAAATGRGYTAGREAGERIGNIRRRIVELEAKAREAERKAGADVDQAARAIAKRLDAHRKDLAKFADRSTERVRRRQAVMRRIDASMDGRTREAIMKARTDAATRLLGTVLEETDVAVIEPGARERAMMFSHLQRGTWKGEITRSFFLFKSFPISMVTRHWARALSEPGKLGPAKYLAALTASTTVLGMVALQAQQVVQGRDPRDMTDPKSWIQALLKGGALSLFGDFLFADETTGGQSILATTAGPVAGLAEDAIALTIGNMHQAAEGKDTNVGAEAVRMVKSNTPGANLWYARAAVDHLVFHQLQEYLSPGYLRKMKRRAEREYDQRFWWEPGEAAPERAPDLEAATGG